MVMTASLNFLPWRRIQFYRGLRIWGLRVCSSWLVCGCLTFYAVLNWQVEQRMSELHVSAERQIRQQMSRWEQRLNVDAQQRAQAQKRRAARQATQAWSSRFESLAEHLPQQAWLNELTYQRGALSISGVLTPFSALTRVDRQLQSISGFLPGKAGKIQRNSEGYWQFQYQLPEEATYAAPR